MDDVDDLIRREQQEIEAASMAKDRRIRRLHLEMANAYTSRINEIKRQQRPNKSLIGSSTVHLTATGPARVKRPSPADAH